MTLADILENYITDFNGCWRWGSSITTWGYGQIYYNKKNVRAHRLFYEYYKGEIPRNLVLDHLCRVRDCVNPDHMEIVTSKENILRGVSPPSLNAKKTTCKNGHPLTSENIYHHATAKKYNSRTCRLCSSLKRSPNKGIKKTHCKNGHLYSINNVSKPNLRRGSRECYECAKVRNNKYYWARK